MVTQFTPEVLKQRLSNLQQHGYTLIPDFLTPERLSIVRQRFDELLGSFHTPQSLIDPGVKPEHTSNLPESSKPIFTIL